MRTQGIRNEELGIRNFLGTDEHGFKKRHGWLRDGNGLISLKAILKKSVIICGQKKSDHRCFFYRPQINTDWHRLRAKGSD